MKFRKGNTIGRCMGRSAQNTHEVFHHLVVMMQVLLMLVQISKTRINNESVYFPWHRTQACVHLFLADLVM